MPMGVLQARCFGGDSLLQHGEFDRRISEAGSSYDLYDTNYFAGIPENGDLFGIVAQLVTLANLADSGVVRIGTKARGVTAHFSAATTKVHRQNFVPRALRIVAGSSSFPFQLKFL